jgi:hypothetical protein
MLIKTIKLGTVCKDKATTLEGTLTHWQCDMGGRIDYLFQPTGINPDDGQPVRKIALEPERLEVPPDSHEEIDVPFEILGSLVRDKASGFAGMAVCFVRHINGCFHVGIQPPGVLAKTQSPIRKCEFDLRECAGEKIPVLTPEEKKRSEEQNPSPTDDKFEESLPKGGADFSSAS